MMSREASASWRAATLRVLAPILLTLVVGGLVLLALGKSPLDYYGHVAQRSLLRWGGVQETLTRMAPLLLIAAGLIVAFRAGIWNLGGDGQFLLAAVVSASLAPFLDTMLPHFMTLLLSLTAGALTGAAWALVPALLKARSGVNEVITTLMMNFLGTSLASALIKLVLQDPATTVPQTRSLAVESRLPHLFGTTVHCGLLLAVAAVIAVDLMMKRTGFGLKLMVLGLNRPAAVHAGMRVSKLTVMAFTLSAALIGLAGATETLGVWGQVRADWNPAYGLLVIPLVFVSRFNGFALIGITLFFSALMVGGESAARRVGVPRDYVLVLVALLLVFLALIEYLRQPRRHALPEP
jgi:simple sugar transport system permease protein